MSDNVCQECGGLGEVRRQNLTSIRPEFIWTDCPNPLCVDGGLAEAAGLPKTRRSLACAPFRFGLPVLFTGSGGSVQELPVPEGILHAVGEE